MRRLGSAGLTFTQVFLLIIGFGVASGLIFLFGMWVGRDLAERRLAQEERIVRQPVPVVPTTTPEEPKEQDADRAFYERMKDKAVERLQESNKVGSTPGSLPNLGQGVATPTNTLVVARPTLAPTVMRFETQVPHPTATARPRPTHGALPTVSQNEWADAGWTVQVNATTDSEQARALAVRLRGKGFDAYVLQAPARGEVTWYRVRVGRFKSRERAIDMEQQLKSDEKLEGAFVTPQ